jgi:hypothetical protein
MAYIYRHIKPNGETFYIGIGKNKSRLYSKYNRNKYWTNIVRKYGYEAQVLKDNISWSEACEYERLLINYYGRKDLGLGSLVNMTDGGEGVLGLKNNIGHTGKKHSQEVRDKISKGKLGSIPWNKGIVGVSDETRLKMSNAKIGKVVCNNGIKRTEEQKSDHSKKMKGRNGKIVLNTETGIFYNTTGEAAESCNMNRNTLIGYLLGKRTNLSPFIYV